MKYAKYVYKIHTKRNGKREIVAVSSYAGKTVKAKAVCNPDDNYNEEIGKEIARLRCAIKIDEKRAKRAKKEKDTLFKAEAELAKKLLKNSTYVTESIAQLEADKEELNKLISTL